MLGGAHHRSRPRWGQTVRHQQRSGGAEDLHGGGAETVAQAELYAAHARVDRVAVPAKRHAGPVIDGPGHLDRGRERCRRQRHQHFRVGQLTHRRPGRPHPLDQGAGLGVTARRAQTGVAGGGPEPVQTHLGVLGRGGRHGPPPPAAHELHPALHRPLAVPPPRRTGRHDRPVMLGHRGEAGLHVGGAGHDHRGQAVGAPHPGRSAQPAQHPVHGLDQMRLVHGLGQHLTGASRMRQGPQQPITGPAPRGPAAFRPVPLDFLAGRVGDVSGLAALHPRTRLAMGAQPGHTHLADEARIRTAVAEGDDLVEQRRGPHVRVVHEPGLHIGHERRQRIRGARTADTRLALARQIVGDRPPVTAEVTGDRGDLPSPLEQCISFHVFSS